jgi:membrane-associated protease RseP (regulator of RpoE activity)
VLLAACLLAAIAQAVLFLLIATALAPLAQVHIESIVLGFGPKLGSLTARGRTLELRALPISAYVMAYGMGIEHEGVPPEALAEELRRRGGTRAVPWYQAPRAARALAFVAAPRFASLVVASAVLGFRAACEGVATGIPAAVRGALQPMTGARALLASAQEALLRRGFLVVAALALCAWIGVSLLTLPLDLAGAVASRPSRALARARALGLLALFAGQAAWFVAWIAWMV